MEGDRFFGVAVSPCGEAIKRHVYKDDGGLFVLLYGYITQIEGKDLSLSDLDRLTQQLAVLYRREGPGFAAALNGSFSIVVYDQAEGTLALISDRLSSRPLRYMMTERRVAFSSRIEAFRHLGFDPTRKLNPEGLAEFFVFGRLLNSRMWDEVTEVPPATSCVIHGGRATMQEYWKIKFRYKRGREDTKERAAELAEALRQATERNLLGFDGASLMLSGGADSRALLACLPEGTACYTSCDRINYETRIARKVARTKGCPHFLLQRSPFHYLDILPTAARITEGNKEFHHAHFVNLIHYMEDTEGRAVLHGLGLDFILRGHYLPTKIIRLGRRKASAKILHKSSSKSEMEELLLNMEGVRLDAIEMLSGRLKGDVVDIPRSLVRRFLDRVEDSVVEPLDALELFVFGNLSAWLTFPLADCLRHYLPERWVAMDNALVDIALSTSPETRFDSRLFLKALKALGRRLCLISNSYTFLPLCLGSLFNVTHRVPGIIYDHIFTPLALRPFHPQTPRWVLTPGPWPSQGYFWREGPISGFLKELLGEGSAMRDGVIDPAAVMSLLEAHLRGQRNNVLPLSRAITFLVWRKGCP